jgi:hypothetical protein
VAVRNELAIIKLSTLPEQWDRASSAWFRKCRFGSVMYWCRIYETGSSLWEI